MSDNEIAQLRDQMHEMSGKLNALTVEFAKMHAVFDTIDLQELSLILRRLENLPPGGASDKCSFHDTRLDELEAIIDVHHDKIIRAGSFLDGVKWIVGAQLGLIGFLGWKLGGQ
jgi:hypothetical protein